MFSHTMNGVLRFFGCANSVVSEWLPDSRLTIDQVIFNSLSSTYV